MKYLVESGEKASFIFFSSIFLGFSRVLVATNEASLQHLDPCDQRRMDGEEKLVAHLKEADLAIRI